MSRAPAARRAAPEVPLGGHVAAERPVRAGVLVCVALLVGACRDGPLAPGARAPSVSQVVVTSNADNALSGYVTFTVQGADSARVRCQDDQGATPPSPFNPVRDGTVRLVLLGLPRNAHCAVVVVATGAGGTSISTPAPFVAGDLPGPLQDVRLDLTSGTATTPGGYTLLEVTRDTVAFIAAFDSAGSIRWYRRFPLSPGELALNAAQQPNGDFTVFIGISTGADPSFGRFYEVRPDGGLVRTWTAPPPYYTDPHELLVEDQGAMPARAHLFGYQLRPTDLTAFGGTANELLAGHAIIRQAESGAMDFLWNTWDHFSLSDWLFMPPALGAQVADFDHTNSLAIARDRNYLVSFAALGQIAKVDAVTGRVLWRLGGRASQFTIVGDPLGGFGPQHDVRELANGDLLLFDNGLLHTPAESRAVEYRLDTVTMTATMVWEYRHRPPLVAPFVGSARRLGDGHTLVGFGALSRVVDVVPDGSVAWEGQLLINGQPAASFYRATRVLSLYHFEQP